MAGRPRATQLLTEMAYDVPPQDLRISRRKVPALPNSGFTITNVRCPAPTEGEGLAKVVSPSRAQRLADLRAARVTKRRHTGRPPANPGRQEDASALEVRRPVQRRRGSLQTVADDHLWTAEELERLTPHDRQRLLDERVVTDLSSLAPDVVERIRQRGRALMEQRGTASRTVEGG